MQVFSTFLDWIVYNNRENHRDFIETSRKFVEALTNHPISGATTSSNPTISLTSSSSSTFSVPSHQSNIYRLEKSESFQNNKDDSDD